MEVIETSGSPWVGPFRVMYSLHYLDGLDLVGVTIAGAPLYEWHIHSATFDQMSSVSFIDMSRFQ